MPSIEQEPNIECRICHSKTSIDMILSPCFCKGSMAFVHFRCLERWLNYSSRNSCELCSFPYNVIMNRRYTCFQSIGIWCRHPGNRAFIMCDLVIALVLTLLTLVIIIICFFGLHRFVEESQAQGIETFWSERIVNLFMFILTVGYFITMYSMASDHIRPWYAWWIRCNNVRLVLEKHSTHLSPPTEPSGPINNTSRDCNRQKCQSDNNEDTGQEINRLQDKCEIEILNISV